MLFIANILGKYSNRLSRKRWDSIDRLTAVPRVHKLVGQAGLESEREIKNFTNCASVCKRKLMLRKYLPLY